MRRKMDQKTREFFLKQSEFSSLHQAYKDCTYYPCHKNPESDFQNCLYCFCPFYPCDNKPGNGRWKENNDGNRVWDCTECIYIHRNEIVIKLTELLYEGKNMFEIRELLSNEEGK